MAFNLANPNRTIHAGVILTGGVTEILDVAPIDLIHGMDRKFLQTMPLPDFIKSQALDISFFWVNEKGGPAQLTSGITIQATHSFENCPPLDIVLIGAHNMAYTPNKAELAFVRKAYEESSAFLTICGGMVTAMMAGVLESKTATAPRFMVEGLRKDAPGTKWVERRWAYDGKVWTSGTLLNGLDMMAAFARHTWSNRAEMVEAMLAIASCPSRDVDYKDVDDKASAMFSGGLPKADGQAAA